MIWASIFCIVIGVGELALEVASKGPDVATHGTGAVILFALSVVASRLEMKFKELK